MHPRENQYQSMTITQEILKQTSIETKHKRLETHNNTKSEGFKLLSEQRKISSP